MIDITDDARNWIAELMEKKGLDNSAIRVAITGRQGGSFNYQVGFTDADERSENDIVVDTGPFPIYVDRASARHLEGATVEIVEEGFQKRIQIENPNPMWSDPVAEAVQAVLDREINPAVAAHGGSVTLLDVEDNTAYIELGGGCRGCGMVDVTLKQGIEVRILEAVPQIQNIVDTTDHAGGTNPYFQPSKGAGARHEASKGGSPFG